MTLSDDFKTFLGNLSPDKISDMEVTVGEIAKKLNNHYYGLSGDSKSHMYIVGSVGRGTCIKGVSDLDILFDLPDDVFKRFDDYESLKQSSLLQDVRKVLKTRYPKTKISGDGQVVVIEFDKYTVELVPGFKQSDDRFKYPDTNDGGSWKYTDPLPEISESHSMMENTNQNFKYIANLLRAWKNKKGFKFGGLLIDSLVYKFLNENTQYWNAEFDSYLELTIEVFNFLRNLNKSQVYWFALGSNQHVYNCENGKFITEAEDVYDRLSNLTDTSENINKELREIFGTKFPESAQCRAHLSESSTEQFIEQMFSVDIKYKLKIDCEITQKGFRPMMLRTLLKKDIFILPHHALDFSIISVDKVINLDECDIYWKVKNEGIEAVKRNCVRGQINKTNSKTLKDYSAFKGEHFVECYIVQNGICIARNKLKVPISNNQLFMV